jgi:cbb3-type cytochrome oxidase cytochrome c subunit
MNHGPIIFLAAFFALAGSWFGLVLGPQVQVGRLQQTNSVPMDATYPLARTGVARNGTEVYRANGCWTCHSQQVGQTGVVCDVVLSKAGTNHSALITALLQVKPDLAKAEPDQFLAALPKTVLAGKTKEEADAANKLLNASGAKSQVWVVPVGPDVARGWGLRRSVAEDYLYDNPVMLGSQRVGPDLANVGVRLPDSNWHLLHLYAPQFVVKGSTMPPYQFLFEKRKIERAPSPEALVLPPQLAVEPGYEIVPKPEASALVAYLVSLRADAPLFDAPVTVAFSATSSTNAPGATNAAPAIVPLK